MNAFQTPYAKEVLNFFGRNPIMLYKKEKISPNCFSRVVFYLAPMTIWAWEFLKVLTGDALEDTYGFYEA